jgi:hypothetical protein
MRFRHLTWGTMSPKPLGFNAFKKLPDFIYKKEAVHLDGTRPIRIVSLHWRSGRFPALPYPPGRHK